MLRDVPPRCALPWAGPTRRLFISHKVYFRNQYTMKGLDDHITRFMYGRAAAQRTSCDAANIPLRRRVLFGPVDQQSVVSSDRVGLFMPPSVSRLAVEGVCCGEVPAADGSWWSLRL